MFSKYILVYIKLKSTNIYNSGNKCMKNINSMLKTDVS